MRGCACCGVGGGSGVGLGGDDVGDLPRYLYLIDYAACVN